MKIILVVFAVLLCNVALCQQDRDGKQKDHSSIRGRKPGPRRLDKPQGGRGAESNEEGAVELRGRSRKCSLSVLGLVELDSSEAEINETKVTERANVENREVTNETLPFSRTDDGNEIEARCLAVTHDLNGTTVDMKCCVAKDNGNITLGQNDEEEFRVDEGYMKCSFTLTDHSWSANGEKICILSRVIPPSSGRSPACQGGAGGGNGNRRRPKNCDLGDGATIDLSTLAGQIPSGGSLAQVQWMTLSDTDVGIIQENGKLLGRFCLPKGNAGDTYWYDPTVALDDEDFEDYTGAATSIAITLLTAIISLLMSITIY